MLFGHDEDIGLEEDQCEDNTALAHFVVSWIKGGRESKEKVLARCADFRRDFLKRELYRVGAICPLETMGGGKGSKKRKHAQFLENEPSHGSIGMGATLTHLQGRASTSPDRLTQEDGGTSYSGEWQTVSTRRQKKTNYPSLKYSELHRLQSTVKLGDLQSLVLYCLADGTAPQWISLRHHAMVKKAVVLFVPGLEKGMFDGSIPLRREEDAAQFMSTASNGIAEADSSAHEFVLSPEKASHVANNVEINRFSTCNPSSPDDYLPLKLSAEQLPQPLKALTGIFSHVWPIRAPGDDRMNKVHSPLQAMLQSPITKAQEEKQADKKSKGPKLAWESKSWENSRVSIVEYLARIEELAENDFVLHPAWWPESRLGPDREAQRRDNNHQTAKDGWLDTQVSKLEDGVTPQENLEQGSVTAGRKILAMDCEMCTVQGGGSALTRISLVEWGGEAIMDELVKPDLPIIDYLTP